MKITVGFGVAPVRRQSTDISTYGLRVI